MSPCAIASGSTATAAIGQIVAMKMVTSICRRKCRVDATYATRSSIAIDAEHVALQRGVAVRAAR